MTATDDGEDLRVFIGRRADSGAGLEWEDFSPLEYQVDLDMLELADTWSLRFRFLDSLWRWASPDNPIAIELNGRPVAFGFVDDVKRKLTKEGGSFIEIAGRDKGGRLVDSAAPMLNLTGIGILDLARKMVTSIGGYDLFPEVVLQNATNRRLMSGGGRTARASSEPPIRPAADKNDRRIRPGMTRAQVMEDWLETAGLLGFSSADGKQFIVGRPNYDQEPQFALFAPARDSARKAEGNVLELDYTKSGGERYARIIVLGSSSGSPKNFGENVQRRGVAYQGPNADGTGRSFTFPKDLILVDDNLHSQAAAKARADQEMALRESTATQVEVLVRGHSQVMGGDRRRANYAPDTMVRFFDEEQEASRFGYGSKEHDYLITRCQLSGSKGARTTRLTMVPKGTDLRMTSG